MSSLRSLNSSSSTSRAFSRQNLSVCTMPHLQCAIEFDDRDGEEMEVGVEKSEVLLGVELLSSRVIVRHIILRHVM